MVSGVLDVSMFAEPRPHTRHHLIKGSQLPQQLVDGNILESLAFLSLDA